MVLLQSWIVSQKETFKVWRSAQEILVTPQFRLKAAKEAPGRGAEAATSSSEAFCPAMRVSAALTEPSDIECLT